MSAAYKRILSHFAIALLACLNLALICILCCGNALYAHAEDNGKTVVVSFGDSYSSGEGNEDFYGFNLGAKRYESRDFLAHRSEKAWPGLLTINGEQVSNGFVRDGQQSKSQTIDWYFVAASGAETHHIYYEGAPKKEWGDESTAGQQKKEWDDGSTTGPPYYLPQQCDVFHDRYLDKSAVSLNNTVDYITMTIGGNDLGFAGLMTMSVGDHVLDIFSKPFLNTNIVILGVLDSLKKYENEVKDDLRAVYSKLREESGAETKIIVAGYPRLAPVLGGGIFDIQSSASLNLGVDYFDEHTMGLVSSMDDPNLMFVDVRPLFNGHESYTSNSFINPLMLPQSQDLKTRFSLFDNVASAYSFHPNFEGQKKYAAAVQEGIEYYESKGKSNSGPAAGAAAAAMALAPTDLAISLVFDVSGSMDDQSATGSTKLSEAKTQSIDFVNAINHASGSTAVSSVQVGVASYATSGYEDCSLSTDPDQVNAAINNLSAWGATNMYSGLEIGINQLRATDGEKMMVFLSDGLNNEGHTDQEVEDLAQQAADEGIKIFTIGFGPAGELNEQLLRNIAEITGGSYSHEDASEMNKAAVGVFSTMLEASMHSMGTVVHSATGSVALGQTAQTGTFQVDENGTLTSYLYWPGSVLDMILLDPKGVEVKEGYPGYSIDTSTIPTTITIANAAVGTWTMSVFGREVSMENEPFWVGSVLAPTPVQEAVPTGGGGSTNNAGGLLILLVVVAIAAIGGVYALSVRKSNEEKDKELYG